MRALLLLMVMAAALMTTAGCSKRSGSTGRSTPAFEQRWTAMAQQGT
jgi:hypothetical protein